jgi:predicted unusual protein kinase regulating ubiquinone biosynthesis (AarF/ABC1/UbiB family)
MAAFAMATLAMAAFDHRRARALHRAVGRQASGASTCSAIARKAIESMARPAQNGPNTL